jgi:hypothetical protein
MKNGQFLLKIRPSRFRRLPVRLARLIEAQFAGSPKALDLFFSFLSCHKKHADGARKAMSAARNRRLPWELRCAAVLMLEHHALSLWSRKKPNPGARSLLSSLGLICGGRVPAAVLDEGFSTTEPEAFLSQLRNRLARLSYIHRNIHGLETDPEKLLDFINLSRRPCKLALARYVLDPNEVAGQILTEIRSSCGLPRQHCTVDYHGEALQEPSPPLLNEFDRTLTSRLRDGNRVLWVGEQTSSELNSLVEYPLGTVALVIKPPGSSLEFEVKRAGVRGPNLLNALYARSGNPVPLPHRLQGASYGYMLDYENLAGGRLSEIYLRVHGVEAPMSRCLGLTAISTVPNGNGDTHLMEYFSNADAFGAEFENMRAEMKRCVEAFEGNHRREEVLGAIGLTTRFIMATVPNQAWMVGTSSFRLDRTADLFSSRGPELYFGEGLGRTFTWQDARRLADELLQEVLGIYEPPECKSARYRDYIDAALALPTNRAVADRTCLDCLAEIGRYWGTLVALGGYTEGESFVSRNVGLKSRWENGQWRTRICFMDHDCLTGLGIPGERLNAAWSIEGMRKDSDWICEDHKARNEFTCLREIYGISSSTEARGEEVFRAEATCAHVRTRRAMRECEPVRQSFDHDYVKSLVMRDELIHSYLCCRGSEKSIEAWKAEATARLAGTMYKDQSLPYFFNTLARNAYRLERYASFYEPAVAPR